MNIQRGKAALSLFAAALTFMPAGFAQNQNGAPLEEIVVIGIRSSLANALAEKRAADNLIEVIQAEDIGKLPDQNLAEVLENVTGVQITREAGVGTGVQIRGTNANRTEINGVSTVGSGAGRSGIDFEDVSSAIISAVEVVKAPEAKTIEGSVGGTINLKTIRPLGLTQTLASFRVQGENSSLSNGATFEPRLSGAWGSKWDTDAGDFGVVLSGSWAKQDVRAFRPRTDRDNSVASNSGAASAQSFNFLPIQFLLQDYDNFDYETRNFSGSLEWAPNDAMTVYLDAIITDQERLQKSSRIQASGVSDLRNISIPTEFETVNFGTIDGENGRQDLGSIQAAVRGVIPVTANGAGPNLRFSTDTNSRLTDSKIFRLGTTWEKGNLSGRIEGSTSRSDTTNPAFNTTLNFINPNAAVGSANQNGTPFVYDLTGGALAWAVAFNAANAPTVAQLLDPANAMLRDVNIAHDKTENKEDALRLDLAYDLDWSGFRSVDIGYRYSKSSSLNDDFRTNVGLRTRAESPRGNLFADVLVQGPTNFNDADGRALFVRDYLLFDADRALSDPEGVLAELNAAIVANNAITGATRGPISEPTSLSSGFFDIAEKTDAFYAQANFEFGIIRGNAGVRYLKTDVDSAGNSVLNGVVTPTKTGSSYDFVLPRINMVAAVRDDLLVRLGWGKDIRRPNFDDLSTSASFSTSPNPPVQIGNPGLRPEEVTSVDLSAEWYFAPSSVVSVGFFHKKRTGLFVRTQENPFEDPVTGFRDTTPPCEGGGIFNPIADINVFGPNPGVGVCVPSATTVNGTGDTTQKGIEVAFQYDLAQFQDKLGWASGFGLIANFTKQKFSGGDTFLTPTDRAATIFALTSTGATNVTLRGQLIDLSDKAYNVTLYYEKYGLSARTRYTWRSAYRSTDFGSTDSFPMGFPVVQDARGQLNASVQYAVNDHFSVGVEGINLTKSDVVQYCVNKDALLCFQGLTDRRLTVGANYRF